MAANHASMNIHEYPKPGGGEKNHGSHGGHAKKPQYLLCVDAKEALYAEYVWDPFKTGKGTLLQARRTLGMKLDHAKAEKVGWPSLFFDLIFVAGIIKVAGEIADDPSDSLYFILSCSLLFFCWHDTVRLENRFYFEPTRLAMVIQFFFFLYMVCCMLMALTIKNFDHMIGFYIGGCLSYTLVLPIVRQVPSLKNYCDAMACIKIMQAIVAAICVLAIPHGDAKVINNWEKNVILVVMILVHELPDRWIWTQKKIRVLVYIPHLKERWAVFVMLSLGESVIALVNVYKIDYTWSTYGLVIMCFFIIWAEHILYFQFIPPTDEEHALRRSRQRAKIWAESHWILCLSLVTAGSGWKLLLKHIKYERVKQEDSLVLGISLFITLLCLGAIYGAHPPPTGVEAVFKKPGDEKDKSVDLKRQGCTPRMKSVALFIVCLTLIFILTVYLYQFVDEVTYAALLMISPAILLLVTNHSDSIGIVKSADTEMWQTCRDKKEAYVLRPRNAESAGASQDLEAGHGGDNHLQTQPLDLHWQSSGVPSTADERPSQVEASGLGPPLSGRI